MKTQCSSKASINNSSLYPKFLEAFIGPLRCRKIKPGLFWGTFDVSTLVVVNIPEPYPEEKTIDKAAFDERFIEFGFWPGDDNTDMRAFFILLHPFQQKDLNSPEFEPEEVYYDQQASEYFLSLQTALTEKPCSDFFIRRFFAPRRTRMEKPRIFSSASFDEKPPTIK